MHVLRDIQIILQHLHNTVWSFYQDQIRATTVAEVNDGWMEEVIHSSQKRPDRD